MKEEKLNAFVGQVVEEIGATFNAGLVVIGDKLGLHRALAGAGPLTPGELAPSERFFRPDYAANLITSWLPALDGVDAKLRAGSTVADVGCGHGASTILMAQAYPGSHFVGFDYHSESIEQANERAASLGLGERLRFAVAPARSYPGSSYELVTMFDCLHDMGDLCTPGSLAQEVGPALGAQAGEARIRDVVESAGFSRFRRAAETPFNLVFEARP